MTKNVERMTYFIQAKNDPQSEKTKKQMEKYLTDFQFTMNEETPDLVISIGGDGTLLQAFHHYQHRLSEMAFVGVHTGHLGFYADWLTKEIEKLVIALATKPCKIAEYPLLESKIQYTNGKEKTYIALNEFTVKSKDGKTLVLDVRMKGKHFETFRGDGLCVSTPSGSTAYNKGLGGAIIHPSIEAFQITEMASINNRVFRTIGSPLVLPKTHTCTIHPVGEAKIQATMDHLTIEAENVEAIQFRVADEKVRFARLRNFPFWNRVHTAFIQEDPSRIYLREAGNKQG